jgi:GR25 family glycosyltransferase involved in LPS biosynthesis
MKAYIINDKNSSVSALGVKNCHNSIKAYGSDIDLHPFQQTSPETVEDHAGIFGDISWNYPINNEVATDKELGINLKPYRTNDYKKVFACTLSHARLWLECVNSKQDIMILEHDAAPWVSSYTAMPQGLAGNSAYIIKPKFADMLLMKLKEKGGWPNDAIMCKQFFPMQLKVVYPYYTTIQGIKSTTTS